MFSKVDKELSDIKKVKEKIEKTETDKSKKQLQAIEADTLKRQKIIIDVTRRVEAKRALTK
jgi:PBP1b-binding outer membrane lipoprotein LpoB